MREMKDSGIFWVGEIPKEWSVWRNKYIFKITKDIVLPSKSYQLLSLTTTGIKEKDENDNGGKVPENYDGYQIVKENDLVMCLFDLDCSAVFSGLSPYNGMISPAYKVLKVKKRIANEQYYGYWFNYVGSQRFYKQYSKSLRFTLNADEFNRLFSLLPPLAEQQRIAEFLDRECGKIDGLKEDIQAQIDTLEQYKRSVITEAVTHGLNPSAPMKDSGIPWVGEIPQNRVKAKIKNVASMIRSGTTPLSAVSEFFENGTINWIQSGDIYGKKYINDVSMKITELALASSSSLKIVRKPFIVMAMYGGSVGNTAISLIDACTNQACCCIKPNDKTNFGFLYYWLLFCREDFLIKAEGGGQPNISQNKIRNEYIFIPSLDEQQEIADYLDNKCAEIEQIIADKKTQIETLDGYKKSLIYEYVTGKKEVV